jgi:hypothetical protein
VAGSTFASIKGHNRTNIRKILELAIFVKPWSASSTPITSIWDGTGLVLPAGYESVGLTTKDDGATWTRDQESSDTMSHGYGSPTRRDITSDVTGLQFTMQESKRLSLELYHGVDLSTTTPDANGNVLFDKPSRPAQPRYEVLAIGKDGDGPDAVYVARILPEAQITEMQEQKWTEADEVRYPATITAYVHEAWGTSMREIWGGPGLDAAAMGFTP